jgi:hypothetical protein
VDADGSGLQKPGGASSRLPAHLASALNRHEKSEIIDIDERRRIARWHAASIVRDAVLSALFIRSPLQSHRASMRDLVTYRCSPLRCPVTRYQNHDIAM